MRHSGWLLIPLLGVLSAAAVRAANNECGSFRECISLATLHSASSAAYAARLYARATQLRPESKEAWLGRGALAQDAGDLDVAAAHLSRAFALDPLCWRVGINIGNLAARQGDMATALRAFKHVIRTNPFVPQAFYSRGFVQLLQGQLSLSCISFQRAWTLKPDLHTIPEFVFALDGLQSLRSALVAANAGAEPCPIQHIDAREHSARAGARANAKDMEIVSIWEDGYMRGQGQAECKQIGIDIVTLLCSSAGTRTAAAQRDGRSNMDVARDFVGRMHALYGPNCAGFVTVHMILTDDCLQAEQLAELQLWDLVKFHRKSLPSSASRLDTVPRLGGGAGEREKWFNLLGEMHKTGDLPEEVVALDLQALVSSHTGRAALQVRCCLPLSVCLYVKSRRLTA